MIKINLLPHREEKRKQRKKDFYTLLALSSMIGVLVLIIVGTYYTFQISGQTERNSFIKAENAKLDDRIKEVANLKQEIDALKARQQAVEDLQGDRNQPVYVLDELVKLTPEGVYLRSLKQEGQRILLSGYAQSNERVSDYLRNLNDINGKTPWFVRPELKEIKTANLGQGRDAKKVSEFTLDVGIKRPRELEAAAASAAAASDVPKHPAK